MTPGTAALQAETVLDLILQEGHAMIVPVRGISMRPVLVDGDAVVIEPFLGLPRPGQIVLARVEGVLVVHRLVDIVLAAGRRVYRLQGDAEPGPDAGVIREDLIGRAVALVRDGRRLPIDDSPAALRRALRRAALRRIGRRLARRAAAGLVALLAAGGMARAQDTFAPASDYRFGTGDVLSLRIWNGERLDELRLTVQSDGEAFLPLPGLGSLPVAGRTVAEIKQDLGRALGSIYRQTQLEVLVLKYAGHRVSLMGEVRTSARPDSGPGEWPLQGPTRLVSFLSLHGGPSPDADLMRIQVIRKGGERLEANLYRAVFQGTPDDDPELRAGDLVFVPSTALGNRKVMVLGEVKSPGVVHILDALGLVEAVARAGGFTSYGFIKGVVVLKRGPDGPRMQVVNLREMLRKGTVDADVPLSPGDIVFVPRRAIATLQEVFSIINPALGIIESLYIIDNFQDGN
jgi:polysaccharide export outer membrane protein